MNVIHFFRSICNTKQSVYILKPCRQISQSFEEYLRGGKHVKKLEIFWMNNKTIIELYSAFGNDVENYADLWGCYPPWPSASMDNILLDLHCYSHPTQPHSVIVNYFHGRNLIKIIQESVYKSKKDSVTKTSTRTWGKQIKLKPNFIIYKLKSNVNLSIINNKAMHSE